MPEATDVQMQTGADTRVRPFAEQARALLIFARDIKAQMDDYYARGVSANRWSDARTDGPPHLLQSGNSANPDDFLNLNSFVTALVAVIDGTGDDATNAAAIRAAWAVLMRACVRAPGV